MLIGMDFLVLIACLHKNSFVVHVHTGVQFTSTLYMYKFRSLNNVISEAKTSNVLFIVIMAAKLTLTKTCTQHSIKVMTR